MRRKVTILGAVLTMLASSVAGATVLRSSDAAAEDSAGDVVEELRDTVQDAAGIDVPLTPDQQGGNGTGESLLLVVAAQVPSAAEATTELAALNSRFGELEGFTIDTADNYDVRGVLVQATPDDIGVSCVTETPESELACPEGATTIRELQPVNLQYVGKEAFASFAFPLPCDEPGSPPCQASRYQELLGTDLGFAPDKWLLLTAFRTKQGAEEFIEFARAVGVTGLVTVQAQKLGGTDVGLGQEPHPDGSGPLLGPLPNQELYQR